MSSWISWRSRTKNVKRESASRKSNRNVRESDTRTWSPSARETKRTERRRKRIRKSSLLKRSKGNRGKSSMNREERTISKKPCWARRAGTKTAGRAFRVFTTKSVPTWADQTASRSILNIKSKMNRFLRKILSSAGIRPWWSPSIPTSIMKLFPTLSSTSCSTLRSIRRTRMISRSLKQWRTASHTNLLVCKWLSRRHLSPNHHLDHISTLSKRCKTLQPN